MEFYEVLQKTSSARDFLDKAVEPQKLKKIVDMTTQARSAGNLQSYKIYIIHSQTAKEAMVGAVNYVDIVTKAPFVLVFCADVKRSENTYGLRAEFCAMQDATLACAYGQLAAATEDLSTIWLGDFDPLEVSRIIHAAPYEIPVAVLLLGYTDSYEPGPVGRALKDLVREV